MLLQGVLGVLCPLLERRYASALGGPAQAAALRAQLQAVERGVLEVGQGVCGVESCLSLHGPRGCCSAQWLDGCAERP